MFDGPLTVVYLDTGKGEPQSSPTCTVCGCFILSSDYYLDDIGAVCESCHDNSDIVDKIRIRMLENDLQRLSDERARANRKLVAAGVPLHSLGVNEGIAFLVAENRELKAQIERYLKVTT